MIKWGNEHLANTTDFVTDCSDIWPTLRIVKSSEKRVVRTVGNWLEISNTCHLSKQSEYPILHASLEING